MTPTVEALNGLIEIRSHGEIMSWNAEIRPRLENAIRALSELEADAKRYRWLRATGGWKHVDPPGRGISIRWENCPEPDDGLPDGESARMVDAAIDRAMESV